MMMMMRRRMRMMIMGVKKVYSLEQLTHQCFALKILPSCGEEGRIKNNIAYTCMYMIYKVFDTMWVPWFVLKFPWHQVAQSQEWKLAVLGDCAGWQVDISYCCIFGNIVIVSSIVALVTICIAVIIVWRWFWGGFCDGWGEGEGGSAYCSPWIQVTFLILSLILTAMVMFSPTKPIQCCD